ncbi:MAG TPA: membrane-binding protein [Flavobacterium sp.]|jgi:antitoxin component YwqK of YwqJK toxin-antitoxin module|nr:membrane-binding protein [Flavobacterium sp.]HPJ10996.1 membrane-binding protein [Flavobacterium sp.]
MKKYLFMAAILVSGMVSAQETEPKLEAYGNLVKATYYYENGQVQQTGFFKDGKLEGQWVAYYENGNKKSVGEFSNGQKTGKWVLFNENALTEVNYNDNAVASVKNWKQDLAKN